MSKKQKTPQESKSLDELKKGFELFDIQGTGRIQPKELRETMEELNLKDKNPVIYNIVCSMDTPEIAAKGGITIEEYIQKVQEKMSDDITKDGIKRLFEFFNEDPDAASIPLSVFVKVAKELHEDATEEELKELLKQSGSSGDELTFDEFYQVMVKAPFTSKEKQ